MDDGSWESIDAWQDHRAVQVEEVADDRQQRRVRHSRQRVPDARGRTAEVPIEVAVQRGMIEARERAVQRADGSSKVFEQRVCVSCGVAERLPIDPRDEADEVTVGACDDPVGRRVQDFQRHGHEAGRREVLHDEVLGLEHGAAFARVGDLEDEPRPARLRQADVLVALARQRSGCAGDAEQLTGEARGGIETQAWCVGE